MIYKTKIIKIFITGIIFLLIFFSHLIYADGISAGSYIRWGNINFNDLTDTSGELAVYYTLPGFSTVMYNFSNDGNTVVSPVYGNTLFFNETEVFCLNNETKVISFSLVNNGNTSAVIMIDTSIISYSRPEISDSVSVYVYIDSNNDSTLNPGDYAVDSISLEAGNETNLLFVMNFFDGIISGDTYKINITAFNINSDTGGYIGSNNIQYCGEGNSSKMINARFGIPYDIICPDWADTFYQINVDNIIGTDNEYIIALNNVDILRVFITSQTELDSWTIIVNPVDTGGYLRLKSPDTVFIASTNYNNISRSGYGAGKLLQADMFDSTYSSAGINYYSDSPIIKINYLSNSISTDYGLLRFYYLNLSDSVWYEATDLANGAAPNSLYSVESETGNLSLNIQHLSHWWLGSLIDTVTVIKSINNLTDTGLINDTFVGGSIFIMGDTVAGDTLVMFGIENYGDIDTSAIDYISLYEDVNNIGKYEEGIDTFAGILNLSGNSWINSSLNYHFSDNDTGNNFIVTVKINNNAVSGETFQMIIPAMFVKSSDENTGPALLITGFDSVTVISLSSSAGIIAFTYPSTSGNPIDTTVSSITVIGTISGASAGNTVTIYLGSTPCTSIILTNADSTLFSCSVTLSLDTNYISAYLDTGIISDWDTIQVNHIMTYIISGTIDREGSLVDSGVIINIFNGMETQSTITNSSGYYSLTVSYSDTYIVRFLKSGYKTHQINIYVSSNYNIDTLVLTAGDFINDGSINAKDSAFIRKYFGQILPEYDIDGDNIIGAVEKEYLIRNYLK